MTARLIIKPSFNTPFIEFDPQIGSLTIIGQSHPEDPEEFYRDLFDAIKDYCLNPKIKTRVIINLEYFNTGTSQVIFNIFRKLESIVDDKREVTVEWQYENDDDDMLDAGILLSEISKLKFSMVAMH